jgi:hypothetical protein
VPAFSRAKADTETAAGVDASTNGNFPSEVQHFAIPVTAPDGVRPPATGSADKKAEKNEAHATGHFADSLELFSGRRLLLMRLSGAVQ